MDSSELARREVILTSPYLRKLVHYLDCSIVQVEIADSLSGESSEE